MDNAKVFEVLSADLVVLQKSLNKYEEMMFAKPEKPGTVKEMVDYYRSQVQHVRIALLKVCGCLEDSVTEKRDTPPPVAAPVIEAEIEDQPA